MQPIRRALAFWLTCVFAVVCFEAVDTFILHNLEPDFGDAFGNFSTVLGIYSILALPAALSHGFAAFLLRRSLTKAPPWLLLTGSAVSAILFLILFYVLASARLDVPVKPLLLPSGVAFLVSLPILAAIGTAASLRPKGAA